MTSVSCFFRLVGWGQGVGAFSQNIDGCVIEECQRVKVQIRVIAFNQD
jgi:hypothetical protein